MKSKDKDLWLQAIEEEMIALKEEQHLEACDKPKNQKIVGCKWIFKKKDGIPGVEKARYKVRLVAEGFSQRKGIYFNEIFSPVVKYCSIY